MLVALVLVSVLVTVFSYQAHDVHHMEIAIPGQRKQFQFTNCNTSAVPIYFKNIAIQPDPVQPGEQMALAVDVVVTNDIGGNIKNDLQITLKDEGSTFDLCQLLPFGFCSSNDACSMLKQLITSCPEVVKQEGSNCQCPFKQKEYNFNVPFDVPQATPPGSLLFNGKLEQAGQQGGKKSGQQLMCLEMQICIGECQ